MLTAFPFSSQVLRAAAVAGSNAVPLAFRRFRAVRAARSAPVISAWPFLLLQKPSVNPPEPRVKQMLVRYMPLTVPDPDQHFKAVLAAEPVPVLPIGLAG